MSTSEVGYSTVTRSALLLLHTSKTPYFAFGSPLPQGRVGTAWDPSEPQISYYPRVNGPIVILTSFLSFFLSSPQASELKYISSSGPLVPKASIIRMFPVYSPEYLQFHNSVLMNSNSNQ
jgi:hypothetical protein